MSYLLKGFIGAALFIGAVVLFNVKLLDLLEVGTCASGGPYVSARPCPPGTGTDILLMMASVFIGLIGAAVFAARGARPGGPDSGSVGRGLSTSLLCWALFFTASGAVILYASLTDDGYGDDAKLGGTIVGITFLVMGLPALALLVWGTIDRLRERRGGQEDDRFAPSSGTTDYRPGPASPTPTGGGGWITEPAATTAAATAAATANPVPEGDTIAQLERLQRLRESGALTEAEFEVQKRRILGA